MASWEQMNFQNSYSPLMEQFIFLHDHIMSILVLITTLVTYSIIKFYTTSYFINKQKENHELEILWTFLPGIVLIIIAFPSLRLLYLSEESEKSPLNIKTLGHQWYWSYEYSDFKELEFDSFMKPVENTMTFRLMETDNNTCIPCNTPIQMFISSTDVLHSWTVPSMGVKADSSPGRLNIVNFMCLKPGLFYGQCSEICGTNHSFMPICLDVRSLMGFKNWVAGNI